MSDINGPGDDLILPFIFVPHGGPEPPELAEYKANHPDWFTIPATFEPHEVVRPPDEAPQPQPPPLQDSPGRWGGRCDPPNHAQRWGSGDLAAASQAFQQANALHGDPVAALRALRDSPEKFTGGQSPARLEPKRGTVELAGTDPSGLILDQVGNAANHPKHNLNASPTTQAPDPAAEKEETEIGSDG
ncbi:MAG: hypothetical protein WBQ75_16805 [Acetobacteraceae bacterium]